MVHNPDFTELLPPRLWIWLSPDILMAAGTVGLLGAPLVPSCFGDKFQGRLGNRGSHTQRLHKSRVWERSPAVRFNCRPEITWLELKSTLKLSDQKVLDIASVKPTHRFLLYIKAGCWYDFDL